MIQQKSQLQMTQQKQMSQQNHSSKTHRSSQTTSFFVVPQMERANLRHLQQRGRQQNQNNKSKNEWFSSAGELYP